MNLAIMLTYNKKYPTISIYLYQRELLPVRKSHGKVLVHEQIFKTLSTSQPKKSWFITGGTHHISWSIPTRIQNACDTIGLSQYKLNAELKIVIEHIKVCW